MTEKNIPTNETEHIAVNAPPETAEERHWREEAATRMLLLNRLEASNENLTSDNEALRALIAELAKALAEVKDNENIHEWTCPTTHYNDVRGHERECDCRVVKIDALLKRAGERKS